jgi:hypothetical protein
VPGAHGASAEADRAAAATGDVNDEKTPVGDAIDQVRLNFNPQAQLGLSLVLVLELVMLGIALDLRVSDVRAAPKTPKALAIGLVSHHLLFPACTFALIQLIRPLPSIALGMLPVLSRPAGHISNFFTHPMGPANLLATGVRVMDAGRGCGAMACGTATTGPRTAAARRRRRRPARRGSGRQC